VRGRRSGNWERVEAARRQARLALGRDPNSVDLYDARPKHASVPPAPEPKRIATDPSMTEYVLTLGEAATRLNMSRRELDALIARGQVRTLPIEFGCVIPTSEVEGLKAK
jgi:hypothetical protein